MGTGRRREWCAEDLNSVTGAEGDLVHDSVELRVVRGETDRVDREFDLGDLDEVRNEGERKSPEPQ